MAPKSPLKAIHNVGGTKQNASLTSSKSPGIDRTEPPNTTDYAQAQNEELDVLQAIYMEDYEEVETKSAWSKQTDRALRLRLRAMSNNDISVVLFVKLTATYPKTLPTINIQESNGVRHKTQKTVEKLLKSKPKELIGEVMIHEIATTIQDVLEDEALFKAQGQALPSLEEERIVKEAETSKLFKEQEKEEQKRKDKEKEEEDRVLQQMVEEEMNRRREAKRKSRNLTAPVSMHDNTSAACYLTFDQVIEYQDDGHEFTFSSISAPARLEAGRVTSVFTVRLVVADTHEAIPPLLVVKELSTHSNSNQIHVRKSILALEDELEALKNLKSHPNILRLLDFRIDPAAGEGWKITVLTEYARKGSLADMLSTFDRLPTVRVRSWTIELLEALDFYHRQGIIHKRIQPSNILLSQTSSESPMQTKLSDAGFQESLHELQDLSKPSKPLSARSAYWIPAEGNDMKSRKTDVWDLGVVFLQMLFGLSVPQKYSGPGSLLETLKLSEPLEELIRKFFRPDPKKRPSAFDLIPAEFLRNDVEVYSRPTSPIHTRRSSTIAMPNFDRRLMRRGSSGFLGGAFSRYASEWVEVGRLGKGGYGEVVKSRNKMDGRTYAVKKIKLNSASALSEVLSEVMLLSRLNHPYVVRYYTAWPEDDFSDPSETDESATVTTMATETNTGTAEQETEPSFSPGHISRSIEFGGRSNTGGLDFISSGGFPDIQFGDDSEESEEGDSSSEGKSTGNPEFSRDNIADASVDSLSVQRNELELRRTSSSRAARPVKSTLYIQMEYCERHTLRDLIRKGLDENPEESWRLFRQVLEGLVHIHSHGIIHRDLKPDNIFIDASNNPRIGDFGLATSGQYHAADRASVSGAHMDGDMTRSVGTTFYVAPELRSNVSGTYNDKVDMYSLGIIFFEMCFPLKTAMERDQAVRALREKQHALPAIFQTAEKALQGSIIESLISHRPSERPTSSELLHSGKVPIKIEDETIRHALEGLSDPNSPYYHQIMAALFSQTPTRQIKDYTWDLGNTAGVQDADASTLLLQEMVKDKLVSIFRRHGAVETQRQLLLPRSAHYADNDAAQLLDPSGTLVQLPYDLILPNARAIARRRPAAERTFAFGNVFRNTAAGGAPRSNGEVDYDIVTTDTLDLALKEAEVIKVLDEVVDGIPAFAMTQMCFHLNHSDLLELILEYCRIAISQRPAVKEVLSKLNVDTWTWQKVRADLRSPTLGVSATSLDDLARFDFRDTPDKVFARIKSIFEGTEYVDRTRATFNHLQSVVEYLKQFNVRRKIYICPLNSLNEKFYSGGILFQCLYDTRRRHVLAAGGRYDRLIEEHKPKIQGQFTGCHAVGMNLGWDRLVSAMARFHRNAGKQGHFLKKSISNEDDNAGAWAIRRCDTLVAAFDSTILRTTGVRMLADLWAYDISAELAVDTRSPEELLNHYREEKHSWIIIIKHDRDLKVKNNATRTDSDIKSENLISHLRSEIRERDHREGVAERNRLMDRRPISSSEEKRQNVQVLISQHRSKKSNKWNMVEAAQTRAQELLADYSSAPIAAVETRDEILDLIHGVHLSDAEGWRRIIQGVSLADRQYIGQIQELLGKHKSEWVDNGEGKSKVAFIYNFRTGHVVLYDLTL
ncbi:Serine/threonine-protein kinase [Tothia fuscella]|uniref:non-specific serine/threonine protein kinase n=1 Tax=Tothia fuscella TaxID=1048955 RepID=A0A9P4TVT9_9PEZI|nr:Serine/threonine-protein kinase [Tothia fuscella]